MHNSYKNYQNAIQTPHRTHQLDLLSPAGGTLTLLAPTNLAFTQLPAEQLRRLLRDRRRLRQLLLSHVIPGTVYSAGLQPFQEPETLAGSTVRVFSDTGEEGDAYLATPVRRGMRV